MTLNIGKTQSFLKRFIDDFVDKINRNDWGVKLTPKFSEQSFDFLDIVISQVAGAFYTSTHVKTVDTNSYIDF